MSELTEYDCFWGQRSDQGGDNIIEEEITNEVQSLLTERTQAHTLFDAAGVEHSGQTLVDRVRLALMDREDALEIAKQKVIRNRKLEAIAERGPKLKVVDGDLWLSFDDSALISVEAIIGGRGPIVKKNVRKWKDRVIAELENA